MSGHGPLHRARRSRLGVVIVIEIDSARPDPNEQRSIIMKRSINRNQWLGAVLGLVAASGLAHSALAQVTWSETPGASVTTRAPATSRTIVRSNDDRTMMMSGTTENGDRYEIRVKNDDVKATLNGKTVPDDRIRIGDSSIELLDTDGHTVASMNTNPRVTSPSLPRIPGRLLTTVDDDDIVFGNTITVASEPPKVMVGINMSDVGPTLREHFGLDEDAGFVVDSVVDGLPASKAGIKDRDIVVSIDGKNVTNATLRDTLNEKEPGQTVKVRILRKGERKDLNLVLEAYDASKLGLSSSAPGLAMLGDIPLQRFYFENGAQEEHTEEAQRAMEEASRAMEQAMAQLNGANKDSMREASEQMRQALEEMRRSQEQNSQLLRRGSGTNRFFVVPPTPPSPTSPDDRAVPGMRTPSTPAPRSYQLLRDPLAGSGNAADAERMAQLEERLNQLNGRLDHLDDRIGKLLDRLERGN